jgi:uncharacterized repeat protein (TIGR03943 family)
MSRQAQAVILLLLGGAVLRISLGDTYQRYVKSSLGPYLIAAGAVLVVTAIMTLWYELRGDRSPRAAGVSDRVEHDHEGEGHHEPRIAWLLVLQVIALLLFAPPALGSYAANRSGTALLAQDSSSDFPPLPKGDPAKISVLDYASRAVFDQGKSLGSRRVQLTGFVITGPTGTPYLARMILTCCAADARPIKIALTGSVPGGLKQDTWLVIIGTYIDKSDKDAVNGERIPYLNVSEVHEIPAPSEPYET